MYDFIRKNTLSSTNSYALKLITEDKINKATVVLAENQIAGRGQAKNAWFSEMGKSLCFSVALFPKNIQPEKQFALSQAISLAIYDMLSEYTENIAIKWPNDILINNKKAVGILIENALQSDGFAYSICGVGLNVNNTDFPADFLATSLALETGREYDLDSILDSVLRNFTKYYELAEQQNYKELERLYLQHLYKKGVISQFRDEKSVFYGSIKGIDTFGRLEIEREEAVISTYGFKEVEFLP